MNNPANISGAAEERNLLLALRCVPCDNDHRHAFMVRAFRVSLPESIEHTLLIAPPTPPNPKEAGI